MVITSKDELIKHLQKTDKKKLIKHKASLDHQEYEVANKTFEGYTFTKEFLGIEVRDCKFVNCVFENVWGFYFILENCTFEKCEFKNARFSHLEFCWNNLKFYDCFFRNVQLDEGALYNIWFEGCNFIGFNILGMIPLANVNFDECNIENGQFQSLIYYKDEKEIDDEFQDLFFKECQIDYSYFNSIDFRNSVFIDCHLYKTSFLDSQFGNNTFIQTKESKHPNYASLDFQTILKSDDIDINILKEYFKINDPDIKNISKHITTQINFQTVFISYSFKDRKFAKLLNERLSAKGIKTFIWEQDAPGGQTLEDIMAGNIKMHDKILFIASENSIKSKACQFELSEGRKKQEDTWENIFFPIHIDHFLFEVKKSQIRPVSKADEYWENIQELCRVNSTDFIKFNDEDFDDDEFDEAVNGIIKELKL